MYAQEQCGDSLKDPVSNHNTAACKASDPGKITSFPGTSGSLSIKWFLRGFDERMCGNNLPQHLAYSQYSRTIQIDVGSSGSDGSRTLVPMQSLYSASVFFPMCLHRGTST